jgi:hypothetical protein
MENRIIESNNNGKWRLFYSESLKKYYALYTRDSEENIQFDITGMPHSAVEGRMFGLSTMEFGSKESAVDYIKKANKKISNSIIELDAENEKFNTEVKERITTELLEIKESEEKKKVYLIVEEKFDGYIIDRISGSLDIAKSYIEERNKVTFATFVIIPINTNGILFHNERGGDVTDTIKNVFNHRFFGSELVI